MSNANAGKIFRTASDPRALGSVMAVHEHSRLSDKYQFIPTTHIIDILEKTGWKPISAQEKRVRLAEREGFQKHMIRFRNMNHGGDVAVNGVYPEVVLTNSHDGSASFVFMAGLFRLVCSNGAIVSEGMFGAIRVKHVGFEQSEVMQAVERVVDETPNLLEHVEIFQAIQLSREQQYVFAESALNMKYKTEGTAVTNVGKSRLYQIGERRFDLDRLLNPVRNDDRQSSLWNTFNVVQEKFIKGGSFEDTLSGAGIAKIHTSKVRAIKGIDENIRVNKELWGLTEKMTELAA